MSSLRVRQSIQHIQHLYNSNEDRSKLENLIRAFRGIQELSPCKENSFYHLAGLHGMPFHDKGETDPEWWGGYCWHRTVLFPTWHRIHLLEFENALRSIPGCQDVTLPFWDELVREDDPRIPRIPSIFTSPTFDLDGRTDNPLYSYKFQKEVTSGKNGFSKYSKYKGYNTVRYPFSGLVGSDKDKANSMSHNNRLNGEDTTKMLNDNVDDWLFPKEDKGILRPGTYAKYMECLRAPNYTVFSNEDSEKPWILKHKNEKKTVVSLESAHDGIHVAFGGYSASAIPAHGDMGDNETAGFDPIFYFHHCFVDYTFSIWQRLNKLTKRGDLTIEEDLGGTELKSGQLPNFPRGTRVDMSTPLHPFKKPGVEDYYTSDDATDLNELGIAYGIGSLDPLLPKDFELAGSENPPFDNLNPQPSDSITLAGNNPDNVDVFPLIKRIYNISLTDYEGSFVIRLFAKGHDGNEYEVGRKPVLSRWNIDACRNCQNHLDVEAYIPIDAQTLELLEGPVDATGKKAKIGWLLKIQTHDKLLEFPNASVDEVHGVEISDEESSRAKFEGPIVEDL